MLGLVRGRRRSWSRGRRELHTSGRGASLPETAATLQRTETSTAARFTPQVWSAVRTRWYICLSQSFELNRCRFPYCKAATNPTAPTWWNIYLENDMFFQYERADGCGNLVRTFPAVPLFFHWISLLLLAKPFCSIPLLSLPVSHSIGTNIPLPPSVFFYLHDFSLFMSHACWGQMYYSISCLFSDSLLLT